MKVVSQRTSNGSRWPKELWGLLLGGSHKDRIRPRSACESVIGGRKENQDRCFSDDDAAIYLVVDGMGGHLGGALASEITIETLSTSLRAASRGRASRPEVEFALHEGLEQAHREMASIAKIKPDHGRMGCTLAAVAVIGDHAYYTHIGDSRVYLIQDGKLTRLTEDETLVQELADANLITNSQVATHRWRHVVTNSLGAKGVKREPHWEELDLAEGDQLVLTSDGLTDELTDEEIECQVVSANSPKTGVRRLIQSALKRKARDNVTCVVTKMQRVKTELD
ncbi:MAG: protein phosphatase 2C domain-containing protein [Planctomycetota bacterium]